MEDLESLFRSGVSKRDIFLSRVFGIFSEDVVRYWCDCTESPFVNLGRPTLHTPEGKWHTLDFTLRDHATSKTYIAEMKCELSYDGYRYLRLNSASQLDLHKGAAFLRFLGTARTQHQLVVKVGGKPIMTDGAILVWGATTPEGVASVLQATGIVNVLSIEEMIDDLSRWQNGPWMERISELRGWCTELFDSLEP